MPTILSKAVKIKSKNIQNRFLPSIFRKKKYILCQEKYFDLCEKPRRGTESI